MERLGRFADQTTPAFTDLGIAAPGINQTFTQLPGVLQQLAPRSSRASARPRRSPGRRSSSLQPLLDALQDAWAPPPSRSPTTLAELLTSLRDTGGLERLLDFIFLGAGSTNGYDALGHFLRAEGVAHRTCLTYAVTPARRLQRATSSARPARPRAQLGAKAARGSATPASTTSLVMARTLAVLKGATPGAGDRQVPRLDRRAPASSRRPAPAREGASARPAGRRHRAPAPPTTRPSSESSRRRRDAAQLPARQLMIATPRIDPLADRRPRRSARGRPSSAGARAALVPALRAGAAPRGRARRRTRDERRRRLRRRHTSRPASAAAARRRHPDRPTTPRRARARAQRQRATPAPAGAGAAPAAQRASSGGAGKHANGARTHAARRQRRGRRRRTGADDRRRVRFASAPDAARRPRRR